jgi:hypothetical protein
VEATTPIWKNSDHSTGEMTATLEHVAITGAAAVVITRTVLTQSNASSKKRYNLGRVKIVQVLCQKFTD